MSHDRFYRPFLSADISAINIAVELVLILRGKPDDKIGRFYCSSVIGYRHQTPSWYRNATRCAILRDAKSVHAITAHYGQT